MSTTIIEAKGVGKRYRIAHMHGGYIALRDVIAMMIRAPFAFIKSKTRKITGFEKKEEFWALKDVSFTVERGESIGIIGANGAGKSTLLKVLTQITPPTEGQVTLRGRVASLLEVGTGFHPELSGRENIMLNGAILGMSRKEIARKFDDIVEFAGIEKFLDTPVKHYSSGMYVRLAFSVAAHLEPDILIVDEVLAVGDAEFQKKCLGKMEEVTKTDGRTILFVSHNLSAVQSLCNRSILLEQGRVKKIGPTDQVIEEYLRARPSSESQTSYRLPMRGTEDLGTIEFSPAKITTTDGAAIISSDAGLRISIPYSSDFSKELPDLRVLISITSQRSQHMVYRFDSHVVRKTLATHLPPSGVIVCETERADLAEGRYLVDIEFIAQSRSGEYLKMRSEFDVITANEAYDYQRPHDVRMTDTLINYSFSSHV